MVENKSEGAGQDKKVRNHLVYGVMLVAVLALVVAVFFLSGGGTVVPTTSTTISPTLTTTVTQIVQFPVMDDYLSVSGGATVLSGSSAALQGAASSHAFTYFGNAPTKGITSGYSLLIRMLTYTNSTKMMDTYNSISVGVQGNTVPFSSAELAAATGTNSSTAMTNVVAGKVNKGPTGMVLYTASSIYGNTIITSSLSVPSNTTVQPGVALGSLLNALGAAISYLKK